MVHFAQSRPAALFHSCARCTPRGVRVTPFGNPGITGCVPLPPAFRSLPRPSSHRLPWASAPDLSLAWPYCSFPRAASYGFLRAPFLLLLCVSFPVPVKYQKKINVVLNNQRKERRKGSVPKGNRACSTPAHSCLSLRKEVIQPHLPVRLPCYDFTPLAGLAFGSGPPCGLACRLRAHPTRMV